MSITKRLFDFNKNKGSLPFVPADPTFFYKTENQEIYNRDIRAWSYNTLNHLKANAKKDRPEKLKLVHRFEGDDYNPYVYKSIKYKDKAFFMDKLLKAKFKLNHGIINRIGFGMPAWGIFIQKGVYGFKPSIRNPRPELDWYNSVLMERLPLLEQIVARYYVHVALNAGKILIQ